MLAAFYLATLRSFSLIFMHSILAKVPLLQMLCTYTFLVSIDYRVVARRGYLSTATDPPLTLLVRVAMGTGSSCTPLGQRTRREFSPPNPDPDLAAGEEKKG